MTNAVIVSTARTPLTKAHRGEFNITSGPQLAAFAVRAAVDRAGIDPATAQPREWEPDEAATATINTSDAREKTDTGPIADAILEASDGVDLLPSTIELAGAEAQLLTRPGREFVLQSALDEIREDYDVILLDCSPSLGVLTLAALTAATGLVIPMQAEMLSHRGVGQLLDTVKDVKRLLNKKLKIIGILPTMYDGRSNHSREVLEDLGTRYKLPVLSPPIPRTVRFAEAPAAGRSILDTARSSKGAQAYREVTDSILAAL